jgi:tetratricopeptide (TPR) repeat protein
MSTGRLAESLVHFQEAVRIDPTLAEAYFNMGLALAAEGAPDRAAAAFSEAVRLDSSFAPRVPAGLLR